MDYLIFLRTVICATGEGYHWERSELESSVVGTVRNEVTAFLSCSLGWVAVPRQSRMEEDFWFLTDWMKIESISSSALPAHGKYPCVDWVCTLDWHVYPSTQELVDAENDVRMKLCVHLSMFWKLNHYISKSVRLEIWTEKFKNISGNYQNIVWKGINFSTIELCSVCTINLECVFIFLWCCILAQHCFLVKC